MLPELQSALKRCAPAEGLQWLESFLSEQRGNFQQRPFYYAFSGATRRFPKEPADLSALHLDRVPDLDPRDWTIDQLARVLLLVFLSEQPRETFLDTFTALLGTADIRESIALYSALPLLPCPEDLVPHAREGLRTNIVDVFDAIALRNPFPASHFDEEGWNQMILKIFFIFRPLYQVQGVERRSNPALARALSDLAHERWAAGRPVSPELWRSCQGHLSPQIIEDLDQVVETPGPGQREAVALLISAEPDARTELEPVRTKVVDLLPRIETGDLSWDSLGRELEEAAARND